MASKHRLPGLRQYGHALDRVTNPLFKKYGHVHSRLLTDWEKIVGDKLSRSSRPIRIHFYNEKKIDGVLVVEVYHSAFATNMMFMEPVIIEKIATYFGYKAVKKLKIVQKPSTAALKIKEDVPSWYKDSQRSVPDEMQKAISSIDDEVLRDSLDRLCKSLDSN